MSKKFAGKTNKSNSAKVSFLRVTRKNKYFYANFQQQPRKIMFSHKYIFVAFDAFIMWL